MNENFGDKIIAFKRKLKLDSSLPLGVGVLNPLADNGQAIEASSKFNRKYYSDNCKRIMTLGITPGRFGTRVTGVPFTDTKRLKEKCGTIIKGIETYEPFAAFVYKVIAPFGGTKEFYSKFYINSACPLGFTIKSI